jgi:NUMOD3 motif
MYLQNKYTSVYNSIIERAKSRILPKEIYTENHHILPKSLGGTNDSTNLVKLTGREHFICHLLLPKMVTGIYKRNMSFALWSMITMDHSTARARYKINSKMFQTIKTQVAQAKSDLHKGKIVSDETRKKMSVSRKKHAGPNKGKAMSEEQKNKLSKAHTGKIITQLTVNKILESRKEYRHSEETKKKISTSQLGKIMPAKTDAQKKVVSEKLKGRVMSEETKRKMAKSRIAYWDAKRAL